MSVDPATLKPPSTKPPITSWNVEWNKSIISNITSTKQLETQCINTKCEISTNECECIKRILFIMRFYSIWIDINSESLNIPNIDENDDIESKTNNNMTLTNESNDEYLHISLSEFINHLKYYSIIQLTNDWLHLRQSHWTDISNQHNTRTLFEGIIGRCTELDQCSIFARVNRDREKFKNREMRKRLYFINNHISNQTDSYDESTEVTTQQLSDSIHDWIFHQPIILLPSYHQYNTFNFNANYIPQKALIQSIGNDAKTSNEEHEYKDDEKQLIPSISIDDDDDEDEDEWDVDASEISILRLLSPSPALSGVKGFEARKAAIKKLETGQNKYFQHSKFVTAVTTDDLQQLDATESINNLDIFNKFNTVLTDNEQDDGKDEEKAPEPMLKKGASTNITNNMGSYEFGIEMMYSQHFLKHARWNTMKEEALNNEKKKWCISINQWQDTMKKTEQWLQCIRGKQIKAIEMDETMGIGIGDSLIVPALISCLLYTNFTDLQRRFSGTTRRYNWQINETDDDIRIKHYRDYYHWGRTLMIAINCYGDRMSEKRSFYHGINTELVFADFTAYFNCPTSTTISLSIASSFASNDGIILKLSGRSGVQTKTKFMDVSWFSDYPNEEERLFYGQHNELEITSIFRGHCDYKKFIRAIKVLDVLTDPFVVGSGGKRYGKITESKYFDYLLSMIKNYIERDKYKEEMERQKQDKNLKRKHWKTKDVPDYMQKIFNHFCKLQTTISINCARFGPLLTEKTKKHELAKYFLMKQNAVYEQFMYCLKIPTLIQLFPRSKHFTLDFGGKKLYSEQFEYFCKTVASFIKHVKENENKRKYQIESINFQGIHNPNYKNLSKEIIRKKRKQYFSNTNCKIECGRKTVNFTLFSKKIIPNYENIYVGNLHSVETTKNGRNNNNRNNNRNNRNNQRRRNNQKNKSVHVWTMFISISRDKLVKPRTIKEVTYYLDSKIYKKSDIKIKTPPFLLKRKGNKTFKVKVKVVFRGKRNDLCFQHMLDFDHPVTITDVIFDESIKKQTRNDIFHSDNYNQYDYYNIHSQRRS